MSKGTTKGGILLMGVLALVALSPAQRPPRTDPGAYVPGPNMPMPNYFTGTYNWVQGYVEPLPPPNPTDPPTQLDWIKLHVNGQEVKHIDCDPNIIHLAMQIGAVIDSTHFASSSTVTVTVSAIDEYGRIYTDSDSAQVTNVFRAYEHQDAGANWPVQAMLSLDISGYTYVNRLGSGWTRTNVLDSHSETSAAFFATHGNVNTIQTGSLESVGTWDMFPARQGFHGSGLVPFNSGAPKTSLVIVFSCTTGINNNWFEPWFWPYEDAYGGWVINQAGHGYQDLMYWAYLTNHSFKLFIDLRAGKTIFEARSELIVQEAERVELGLPALYPIGASMAHFLQPAQGPIWGDFYAKLKGVYTGDNTHTLDWYK